MCLFGFKRGVHTVWTAVFGCSILQPEDPGSDPIATSVHGPDTELLALVLTLCFDFCTEGESKTTHFDFGPLKSCRLSSTLCSLAFVHSRLIYK